MPSLSAEEHPEEDLKSIDKILESIQAPRYLDFSEIIRERSMDKSGSSPQELFLACAGLLTGSQIWCLERTDGKTCRITET
eukprot:764909-Hanusia_phi.AAC.4